MVTPGGTPSTPIPPPCLVGLRLGLPGLTLLGRSGMRRGRMVRREGVPGVLPPGVCESAVWITLWSVPACPCWGGGPGVLGGGPERCARSFFSGPVARRISKLLARVRRVRPPLLRLRPRAAGADDYVDEWNLRKILGSWVLNLWGCSFSARPFFPGGDLTARRSAPS